MQDFCMQDNFFNFYVVTWPKFGQISIVQYLSFHLAPNLSSFKKIDMTFENGKKHSVPPPLPRRHSLWMAPNITALKENLPKVS